MSVQDRIAAFFLSRLHLEVPSADTDLFETGFLDSLGLIELMLHFEQAYGVKISLEDLDIEHFRSVARIAAFLLGQAEDKAEVGDDAAWLAS